MYASTDINVGLRTTDSVYSIACYQMAYHFTAIIVINFILTKRCFI